ncbi:hypothetical protein HN51_052995 [Arachis hypogaea]
MEHTPDNGGSNGGFNSGTREVRPPDLEVDDKMEERVFFDEMIEESDDTEEFQGMYQDEIEQEAVNSEDLGEQEFQAMFDGNDFSHELSYVASRRQERFYLVRDTVMSLIEDFKIEDEQEKQVGAEADYSDGIFPKNPQNCRSKCRPDEKVKRKPQRCSICRMEGHNKKSCPLAKDIQQQTNATSYGINRNHVEEGLDADAEMEFWASDLEEDYEEQEFWAGDSDASADMELSEEFSM